MNNLFVNEYDLNYVEKITTKRYGFDLFVTPEFKEHFVDKVYEETTALLIRQNAKGVDTFIDIGAHYGFFDVLVGLSNPKCKILAFEPAPQNYEILTKNIKLHDVDAQAYQSAVSDRSGLAAFQISEASAQSGFVANPAVQVIENIEVEVVQLDRYIDSISAGPILIKMNVAGNEYKVLEGMQELIRTHEDVRLVIEFNPVCLNANGVSPQSLLEKIDNLGFDIFVIFDDEKRYEKYHHGREWGDFMGERTHRNLFCIKKNRSLNLCFFSHSSFLAGAEHSLLELVGGITATYGTLCTVVLPNEGPLRLKLEELGVAIIVINYVWWCATTLPSIRDVNASMQSSFENLNKQISAINGISPDVILSNTLVIPWGALAALDINCPHVWCILEYGRYEFEFYFTFQKTLDMIRESSDHIIFNSKAVKETLYGELGINEWTVATYSNLLEDEGGGSEAFFKYPSSIKLIISGTVIKMKGQDDAVHAVKRLLDKGYDVELIILGHVETPFGEVLKEFVRAEKLEDRIHFYGFFDNVRPLIEQADIGLTCSRTEALGRSVIEALLMGKPVIGTNIGGTVDLIDDGVDGFLYSPGNVDQLVEKIAFFADAPQKIREFGARVPQNIARKLSEKPHVVNVVYKVCQDLKGKPNRNSKQLSRLLAGWQKNALQTLSAQLTQSEYTAQLFVNQALESKNNLETVTRQLNEREQVLQSLNARLWEIYGSRAWHVIQMLWKIRVKLTSRTIR